MTSRSQFGIHHLLFTLLLFSAWLSLSFTPPLMDEVLHIRQISRFMSGDLTIYRRLEMLPTFHLLYAGWAKLLKSDSIQLLRLFSVFWSCSLLAAAWWGCQREEAPVKVWQILTLPLLFPFFFLVYTDVPALTLLVLAVSSARRGFPKLACVALVAACLLRQNHLVWFPFVLYLARSFDNAPRGALMIELRRYWYYFASGAAFAIYFLMRGGVSLNVPPGVANISFHPGNIIFLLALLPIIFLPFSIERSHKLVSALRKPKIFAAIAGVSIASYLFFFAPHPFNKFSGHLRTYLFLALEFDPVAKAGFAVLAGLGALFLFTELFEKSIAIALAVSTFVSLYPLKLIEVRYLLPALVFGLLLKREGTRKWGWIQIAYGATLSGVVFVGTARQWWFW